jgi:G3E family GTPase
LLACRAAKCLEPGCRQTTRLSHLLAHRLDLRIGAVVNAFRSIGVDAMLIGGSDTWHSIGAARLRR